MQLRPSPPAPRRSPQAHTQMVCKWSDAYTEHLTPPDVPSGRSGQPAFRNHLGHANNLLMRVEFDKQLLRFDPAQGVTAALFSN